eukprot:TRINITY_DN7837_c0_g1_i4.p1 TRINITY_DN7837_c0_g1~~TRINITY_DN7837_c0_g1_i4.p1  ORF type:complete len:521 (+),score=153.50 TRINITY_DN7837_c0_g1_i4:48-1610(+)
MWRALRLTVPRADVQWCSRRSGALAHHQHRRITVERTSCRVGRSLFRLETGRIAALADGAILARQDDTVVLTTVVADRKTPDESGFLPLTVDYREKVLSTLQATDGAGDAVTMAINSASAALMMSTIPFAGPVAAVRVGRIDGRLVVNPDVRELAARGTMDLLYAGTETRTLMIEFSGSQVPEAEVIDALQLAHRELQPLLGAQADLAASAPPADLTGVRHPIGYKRYQREARKAGYEQAFAAMTDASLSKAERGRAEGAAMSTMIAAMRAHATASAGEAPSPQWLALTADAIMRRIMSDAVISENARSDGRRVDEVRPITAEADVLPVVHGSALFTRGQTQALCTVTLGPSPTNEVQRYLGGTKLQEKRAQTAPGAGVYLHYEFPPYSATTPDDSTPAPSPTAAEAEVAAPAAATAPDDSTPAPSPTAAAVAAEDAAEGRPAPSVFDALLAPKKAPAKRRSAKTAASTTSTGAGDEEEQALTALSKADLIAKARALGVAMYGSKVAIAQRILAAQKKDE